MASRTAGRHRDTGRRPPSLLTLDYPEDRGVFGELGDTAITAPRSRRFGGQPPRGRRFGGQPPRGRRSPWERRTLGVSPFVDRRVLAVVPIALAGVVAAGVFGSLALLSSPRPHRDPNAATPGVPLPALAPMPKAMPGSQGKRAPGKRASAHHPRHIHAPAAPAVPSPRPPEPGASQVPRAVPDASPSAASRGPTISVRYLVISESAGGFRGEVEVINNGQRALSGWQIVIALNDDQVTSVQNATGFVSNDILLLQPIADTGVVPANGGVLSVLFTAAGTQAIPLACAFDGIACR